jgi:hypothetical protein
LVSTGFTRSDHVVPPAGALVVFSLIAPGYMGIAGKSVENEDGIGPVGVEFAERFVGQGDRAKAEAAVEHHLPGRFGKGEVTAFHQQGWSFICEGSVHCQTVLRWFAP